MWSELRRKTFFWSILFDLVRLSSAAYAKFHHLSQYPINTPTRIAHAWSTTFRSLPCPARVLVTKTLIGWAGCLTTVFSPWCEGSSPPYVSWQLFAEMRHIARPVSASYTKPGASGTSVATFRIRRAGFPAATWYAGTLFVTTDPPPITQPSPMVTPGLYLSVGVAVLDKV